jgi:spermidine synthase
VAVTLLPFSACMGATFPLAVSVLRSQPGDSATRPFSYLYVANVVGATAGTLLSAFILIEVLGFRGTLAVVAFLNASLGALALLLSMGRSLGRGATPALPPRPPPSVNASRRALLALFVTGLASMGMEVVWTRQFTPYLGNVVYTFAIILGGYLGATFLGATAYRRLSGRDGGMGPAGSLSPGLWGLVFFTALLPLLTADPRAPFASSLPGGAARVLAGTVPFCACLGFVTPLLMDRWSGGDPHRVGSAYGLNVVGCLLGPLVTGFGLLPWLGEPGALVTLAVPLIGVACTARAPAGGRERARAATLLSGAATAAVALLATRSFESLIPGAVVRRDATATVAAFGAGMEKRLIVNGTGMTELTPITKMMAHLPLSFRPERPTSALVICFGMGTSYRSALAWEVPTTAVELVPSVPLLFGFFHPDADQVVASPLGRIVVDDGRRFLERSPQVWDVVIVDPPPPVEAAGSSLLYSREFYQAIRRRLTPEGILQQWIPSGEPLVVASFVRALTETFPHVRAFFSVEGWGMHLLASPRPLPSVTGAELAARLPSRAARDLLEWGPQATATDQFAVVLAREIAPASLTTQAIPPLTDDRPLNEYYFLRRRGWR